MQSLADFLRVQDPRPEQQEQPTAAPSIVPTNLADLVGKEFCDGVVNSREYRESILRRILIDELAPAVECRLLDHAWGPPPKRIEHVGKDGGPIDTITRIVRVVVDARDSFDDSEMSQTTH